MIIETIVLGIFAAVGITGIVGAIVITARDGYRRIPTRRV